MRSKSRTGWFAAALSWGIVPSCTGGTVDANDAANVRPVFTQPLPNVPGNTMTALLVQLRARRASPTAHYYAGSVFAYVLSGAIRSQVGAGAAK